MTKRVLLPWEINHLRKYGFTDIDINEIGTTPVEYITGHAEFLGHDLLVTPDVLIPRIETEKIVDISVDLLNRFPPKNPVILADVGCGSGALGIVLADRLKKQGCHFHLYLSDISKEALQITRTNIDRLLPHSKDTITVLRSDLLGSFPHDVTIDGLVSNLPYIPSKRIAKLDSSVKDHEPHQALDGGPDGTLLINKLLDRVAGFIRPAPTSFLILEIDSLHQVQDFHIPDGFIAKIQKDDFGKNRYLLLKKG